jgi:hypothetical protein
MVLGRVSGMAGRILMSDSGKADAARAEATTALARAGLLTPSHSYKPFRYPWAYDFWKKQQQVHWMPEEVPLGEDVQGLGGQAQRPSATC